MRKIILLLIMVPMFLLGQKIGSYEFIGENNITVFKKENTFEVLIEASTVDALNGEKGYLILKESDIYEFEQLLSYIKEKYLEWEKVSKLNNVESVFKEIETERKFDVIYYSGKTKLISFKKTFYIDLDVKNYNLTIWLTTGKIKSSFSDEILSNGILIPFKSLNDIEYFQKTINIENIKSKILEPKKEDLFKK